MATLPLRADCGGEASDPTRAPAKEVAPRCCRGSNCASSGCSSPFRFTLAFHAREIRFESLKTTAGLRANLPRDLFLPRAARHDPTELFLQLEDLLTKSRMLGPRASARDARNLMTRMLSDGTSLSRRTLQAHLEESNRLRPEARLRFHQDVALL